MASQPGKALTGKAFDLKSAYRQLGIHPGSLRASYIAVYNPHQARPEVFQMLAGPVRGYKGGLFVLEGGPCPLVGWMRLLEAHVELLLR